MVCEHCGRANLEKSKFCQYCGSAISAQPLDESQYASNYFLRLFYGRVNRLSYFCGGMVLFFGLGIIAWILQTVFGSAATNGIFLLPDFVLVAVLFFYSVSINTRRLHDIGRTGWLQLLFFIPIFSFFFGLYMLFYPGQGGTNQYGKQPLSGVDLKKIFGIW